MRLCTPGQRSHLFRLGAAALGSMLLLACSQDWDLLDPRVGGGSGAGSSTGGAASTGGGEQGGAGEGGAGAQGGVGQGGAGAQGGQGGAGGQGGVGAQGGAGGAPPALSDGGLIARYYLDEASSGQAPGAAQDSAAAPLDLDITYAAGMSYAEEGGQRGLSWNAAGIDGVAATMIGGTKIEAALDGGTTGTIEAVIRLDNAVAISSRLVHIGEGTASGRFTLFADDTVSAGCDWSAPGTETAVWPVPFANLGRTVLHMVLDTNQAAAASRVKLYIDGTLITDDGTGDRPAQGETTVLVPTAYFALGNRFVGARSFSGVLFYSAVYSIAMKPADIANNVGILTASDDTP